MPGTGLGGGEDSLQFEQIEQLVNKVDNLKLAVEERVRTAESLQTELEMMDSAVNDFVSHKGAEAGNAGAAIKEANKAETENKDCLMFHGVLKDEMEEETGDEDIKKTFLDHNIKKHLKNEWGIECSAPFKHVFRWGGGPRVNGVEPVLVIFEDKREKDQVWSKLRDNLRASTNIVVTQDSSTKRKVGMDEKETTGAGQRKGALSRPDRKMAIVKPSTKREEGQEKKPSLSGRNSSTPEVSEQKPQVKERKISRSSQLNKSPKKSVSKAVHATDQEDEEDVYGGLDASKSVIIHGIESDWIEEEMSDDDDFRKDVLEQKVKKVVEEIGLTKKIGYKNLFRWASGPIHNGVPPVVVEFKEKKDRNEVYYVCKEGLKKSSWVITEDSRSRLGGQKPKEVSSKLNFSSFMEHYQSYSVAQALFNKMVRLL